MEFKHSCDFDDCHYLKVENKFYKLGFIVNLFNQIYPATLLEITGNDLPLELQVEWGLITLREKLRIEESQAEIVRAKIKEAKKRIELLPKLNNKELTSQ